MKVTILCSPKPFVGVDAHNQLNALRSWRKLGYEVEIIIFGDVAGASSAAQEIDAVHVQDVCCSPSGAPLFNDMVRYVTDHGLYDLQLYCNCDILLDSSIVRALEVAYQFFGPSFLLVGERLDLASAVKIDVQECDWQTITVALAATGLLSAHGPSGLDYFGFVRNTWIDLAPVFMGRALCDQALLHYCLSHNIPVIDATLNALAVHQHHSYTHVSGARNEVFFGQDRKFMAKAHGLSHSLPTIADAQWQLDRLGNIRPATRRSALRKAELSFRYSRSMPLIADGLRAFQYACGRGRAEVAKMSTESIVHATTVRAT